jgi:hypothetical protein
MLIFTLLKYLAGVGSVRRVSKMRRYDLIMEKGREMPRNQRAIEGRRKQNQSPK